MFKKSTWYLILIIALAGLVSLSLGFVKAMRVTSSSNTAAVSKSIKTENTANKPAGTKSAAPAKDPNSIKILIMGDSVAYGTGDEKGKGFSTYLVDCLKPQTTKKLSVDNIGINGLKIDGLREQLQDEKPKSLVAASDIVLISIGGNDLRELRRSRDNTALDQNEFKAIEDGYLKNLKETLKTIKKSSPNSYIVFVGLYNPYEKTASSYEDTKYMNTWNYDTQQLVEADAQGIFIPTYDLFKFNLNRFLAPDGLHPNSLGYQAVSNRIAESIESVLD